MEPIVACALDPDSGDRGPVELARLAAVLLGGRVLTVIVRPGGSAAERLSRLEKAHGAEPGADGVPRFARADRREIQAPSPAAGLHRVLAELHPALLVAGSPTGAAYGRVGLGTTTERLLDGAPCPVAIAPRGWTERPLGAIAVAMLPTPEGSAALDLAAALAHAAGVPLRLVMVLSDSPDADEAAELARALASEQALAGVGAGETDEAPPGPADVLGPALTSAAHDRAPRIEAGADVYVGDPSDTLVRASARAGLLVLGSRAYGHGAEVHAGGVARSVLMSARCPVVLVPRGA
jgi:nucleotide-binding universal stress UspA family protein